MTSSLGADAAKPYVVLAGADGGPDGRRVIEAAAATMANRMGGELHILHLSAASELRSEAALELLEHGRASVDRVASELHEVPRCRVFVRVHSGTPWHEIVDEAARIPADLIVVGTHGRTGIARLVLGSQGEQVLRHAPCPVLVVRDAYPSTPSGTPPPCPECEGVQNDPSSAEQWCAKHADHGVRSRPDAQPGSAVAPGRWLIRP